jgi:hypothetical protein
MGADAKTDQIDAKVISQFASVLNPIASEAQSDEERRSLKSEPRGSFSFKLHTSYFSNSTIQ